MRICVIFNPTAKGEKAKRFKRHIDDIGAECALKLTWAAGTARLLAAEAVRDGFDTIVAAGGDGTLNEVLNGIGDEPEGFARARLAMLPLGTVNVFAREFGIPIGLRGAWKVIRAGRERAIDLPLVEFSAPQGPQRRYFAQLAGAGLDARAIELIDWQLKKKIGPFAYIVAALKAMRDPQFQIEAAWEGQTARGELILIGNGRYYGGSFPIFPRAGLSDGLLDVCVFPRASWKIIGQIGWSLLWRDPERAGIKYFRAEKFTLTSSPSAPVELEGDTVGHLPATFSVQKQRLRIIVP